MYHWALALAAAYAVFTVAPTGAAAPQPGDQAPDFTLDQLDGEPLSLSDFDGTVVFINFFGYN